MTRTVVFLQAPSLLEEPAATRHYWTVHPQPATRATLLYPPATLAAASRRISALYENVIFREQASLEDVSDIDEVEDGGRRGGE